jgi:hypothetical protein
MMIRTNTGCKEIKYRVKRKFGILAMKKKYTIKKMVRKAEKAILGVSRAGRLLRAVLRTKQTSRQIFRMIARYKKSDIAKNRKITSRFAQNMPDSSVLNTAALYFAICSAIWKVLKKKRSGDTTASEIKAGSILRR